MTIVPEFDDLHARLLATRSVQERLALSWLWEEKTLAQWDDLSAALLAGKARVDDAEAAGALSAGALSRDAAALHEATKQALGLAKVRYRDRPETLRALAGLRASKGSVAAVRRSADDLAAAWGKIDGKASYNNVSLPDYSARRAALESRESERSAKRAGVRQEKKDFLERRKTLHRDLVAWYAAASRVFPANTPEGQLLRAEVPTM